jgi:VCBS repeat-containing protein
MTEFLKRFLTSKGQKDDRVSKLTIKDRQLGYVVLHTNGTWKHDISKEMNARTYYLMYPAGGQTEEQLWVTIRTGTINK